ncbi:MAG: DUF998 domain-containing protein [Enterococcus sp.]
MTQSDAFKLPDELVDRLKKTTHPDMTIDLTNGYLEVQEGELPNKSQLVSLRGFLIPSLLASAIFFTYFFTQGISPIPLSGHGSVGTWASTLGVLTGVCTLAVAFIIAKKGQKNDQAKNYYWRNFPTFVISFAIILLMGIMFSFRIFNFMLPGIAFDVYTSTLLFFLIMAIINYLMIFVVYEISPQLLTNILTIVIIGGGLWAMATNRDLEWWTHNFSFLGTTEAAKQWQFNLTLILSAILMIALIDYLFVNLKPLYGGWRLTTLRWILILIALNLGGVGLFPYKEGELSAVIHNQVAANLVYLIIILIVGMHWILPKVTVEFKITSYIVMGLLVATVLLFQTVHYFSLTAFEFFSFLIAFSWLLILFQYLQSLIVTPEQQMTIRVKTTSNE